MENKYTINTKNYSDILPEKEIITIGLILRKFEREQISYQQLKQLLKDQGIELTPRFHEPTKFKHSIKEQEENKKRIEMEQYDAGDFDGYLISGSNYENVVIRYDRMMIEILAKNGDEDAIRTRNILIQWEEKNKDSSVNKRKK